MFAFRRLGRMKKIMREVRADFRCEPAGLNGKSSHVHLLVNFPPKAALPRLVNSLRGVSSRRMRQEFPDLRRRCRRAGRPRAASCFAGPGGGAPVTVLRQYTGQQDRPA